MRKSWRGIVGVTQQALHDNSRTLALSHRPITALAQIICFPWGEWQLHWLIVNDKGELSSPRVRGWLPRWVSPWQRDDQATQTDSNVYISLSLWGRVLTQSHTPTAQARMKQDEAGRKRRRCPEHSSSSSHHLNKASRSVWKDERRFWSFTLSSRWYSKSHV